jgi:hypothetical protein
MHKSKYVYILNTLDYKSTQMGWLVDMGYKLSKLSFDIFAIII